jgi:hypothetical protein
VNKKVAIGVGIVIGIAIIISIISFQIEIDSNKIQEGYSTYPDNPQTVGSLTINKDKYMIGEVVFVTMELNPLENGLVEFYNQDEKLFYKFKFNGSADQSPNLYFRPMLENRYNICTVNDLIGTWTVKISGVTLNDKKTGLTIEPREMQFNIVNEIIADDERFESWTKDVCSEESLIEDALDNRIEVPIGSGDVDIIP